MKLSFDLINLIAFPIGWDAVGILLLILDGLGIALAGVLVNFLSHG